MKLKVKIPNNNCYPVHYMDKEVEINIESVSFPDGTCWSVFGLPEIELLGGFNNEVKEVKSNSFAHALGQEMKELVVKF